MDGRHYTTREENPRHKANVFSLLTFFFSINMLKKGYKNDLKEGDIYEVMSNFRSEKLTKKLERIWEKEKKNNKNPSLTKTMLAFGFKCLFVQGIIQIIITITITIVSPRSLGKVVAHFNPYQKRITREEAIFNGCILIAIYMFNAFYHNFYMYLMSEICIKFRAALSSLTYRKCLKVSSERRTEFTTGKILTLINKDMNYLERGFLFLSDLIIGIIQICIVSYVLYIKIEGLSFVVTGFILFMILLLIIITNAIRKLRIKCGKKTDNRMNITQECLSAIKIVKMYTWEVFFATKISKARKEEIKELRKVYYFRSGIYSIADLSLKFAFYILIITYLWMGKYLTGEIVYYCLSAINSIRQTMVVSYPYGMLIIGEMLAALKRIQDFLLLKELPSQNYISKPKSKISLTDVSVVFGENKALNNISLHLGEGLNVISGDTGTGKSCLLKVIMQEIPVQNGKVIVTDKIAYVSEEPWLFPGTIRQNILFGEKYNKKKYEEIVSVCALNYDFNLFPRGDQTVVSNRGLNISKGQQSRIHLARAVYRDCNIYLIDDCLSCLNIKVQYHILNECIKKYLKGKIVVVVSHNNKFVQEADKIVYLENGTINTNVKKFVLKNGEKSDILPLEFEAKTLQNYPVDKEAEDSEDTKLLNENCENSHDYYHEVNKIGQVEWGIYKKYLSFGGGFMAFGLVIFLFVAAQIAIMYGDKTISKWVNIEVEYTKVVQNKTVNNETIKEIVEKQHSTIITYTIIMLVLPIMMIIRTSTLFYFTTRASVKTHKLMIQKVISATMEFFDTKFIGNILNRFSKDLATIDDSIGVFFHSFAKILCSTIGILILIASTNLIFLIPTAIFITALIIARVIYIPTGRSLKRLESSTRAPILGHLNSTLEGLTTVRVFEKQKILQEEFDRHQDVFTSVLHMSMTAMRLYCTYMEVVCVIFIAVVILFFLFSSKGALVGNVGLAITQSFMLSGVLTYGARQWSELESAMTGVERVIEYTTVKMERKTGVILEKWPKSGVIKFEGVSLAYENSNQTVLKNINFTVQDKEKIGIVGRTGAGKSSIISCLFGLYNVDGHIYIDDVDTKTISLNLLRSKIAIIPQDPILFSDTIRNNIDPNHEFSDEEIWSAVESVNLKHLVIDINRNLKNDCLSFSSGQKQLLCLARALIQKSKIIVLDEPTAKIDLKTDTIIHAILETKFSDCTVLIIAHKFQTVMNSNRVMVVENGEILEFDHPLNLLNDKNSKFSKMIQ